MIKPLISFWIIALGALFSISAQASSYTVSGSVSGLAVGKSLVLLNNGTNARIILSDGTFTFSEGLVVGSVYKVTVAIQPSGQRCSVSNGTGTINGENISSVAVACVSTYSVSGLISGLESSTLVLRLNGASLLVAPSSTSFRFSTALQSGATYAVSVGIQPSGFNCVVTNGTGTIVSTSVTIVSIACQKTYTVSGIVSGLTGPGLVLQLNGSSGPTKLVAAGAASFSFSSGLGSGVAYNVTVSNQPFGLKCSVLNPSGTIEGSNITNIEVSCSLPTYVVSTLAGSGAYAFADGLGTAASFNNPSGITVDSIGNLYVADTGNQSIRKITPAGLVTKLAGSGSIYTGSRDGTGGAARFYNPTSVAVDSAGNVYVADTSNNRIRKVTADGVVSTLAGSGAESYADGVGVNASFYQPCGIAVDGGGNVYVAEWDNRIRKITPSGVVTTLAGSGTIGYADGVGSAAMFYRPVDVAVDSSGNLYVADLGNHRIRKITPDGTVSTIAGSGARWPFADGVSTQATFESPRQVAVDRAGNVYVGDDGVNRIRKITPDGMVSTVAGTSARGYVDGPATSALFDSAWGVAVDESGNLYVSDHYGNRIRKITPQ